jgi:RNA polymerase sigma-54 factor
MLDDNPFLELTADEAPREEFGLAQADTPVRDDDRRCRSRRFHGACRRSESGLTTRTDAESPVPPASPTNPPGTATAPPRWCPTTANGAATRPRARTTWATTARWTRPSWRVARSRCSRTCTARRWRCAWVEEDSAALRFLIESLNDDGYLEDSLEELAMGLAGRDERAARRTGAPLHRGAAPAAPPGAHPAWGPVRWANASRCNCAPCGTRAARRRPATRRCASAPSPWSCWRGATSSA